MLYTTLQTLIIHSDRKEVKKRLGLNYLKNHVYTGRAKKWPTPILLITHRWFRLMLNVECFY